MMILRLLPIIALAVFLLGCNKSSDTTKDSSWTVTSSVTSSSAPAASTASPSPSSTSSQSNQWTTTASGLKYQVLKHGTGTVSPKATDTVKVHYHGTFPDGRVFDSSVQRGEPATFPLNQVIAGWTEGLQLMKVGDKFKFEVPPDLAYGPGGRPGIPPNSTLVFEVELLGIE